MTAVTKQQQDEMLNTLYHAYLSQQAAGVGPELQPNMDLVQKQIRSLPIIGEIPPTLPPVGDVVILPPYTHANGLNLDFFMDHVNAFAIPIDLPNTPYLVQDYLYGSIAPSNGGTPIEAKWSAQAGDFVGSMVNPAPGFQIYPKVGGPFPPGSRGYFNVKLYAQTAGTMVRFFANFPR